MRAIPGMRMRIVTPSGRNYIRLFGGTLIGPRHPVFTLILAAIFTLWTLVAATLAVGQGVQYIYDDLNRLVGVVDPSGEVAQYSYDAAGNLLAITWSSSSQVSIIDFSPRSGPVGTTVTITGTGFSATPEQNTITFNGVAALVNFATTTQLVTAVPSGATTGPSP